MGFIVPQGKQSLVSSIGMTERLSLFRQQALRPYKRALWAMAIIMILAIGGLATWNVLQAQKYNEELQVKQEQIDEVQKNLQESDELINALNEELVVTQEASAVERARIQKKLKDAQAERVLLLQSAQVLHEELQKAADAAAQAGQNVADAQDKIDDLERRLQEEAEKEAAKAAEAARAAEAEKAASASKIKHYGTSEDVTISTPVKSNKTVIKHY